MDKRLGRILLIIALVLFLSGGSFLLCYAQANKDIINMTTYFPSPNLAAQDFYVKDTMNVSQSAVIPEDSSNITNSYLAVENVDGSGEVLYVGEDSGSANFVFRFDKPAFVGDMRSYICSGAGSDCKGEMQSDIVFKPFATRQPSLELEGVVLTGLPSVVDADPAMQQGISFLGNLTGIQTVDNEYRYTAAGSPGQTYAQLQDACLNEADPADCIQGIRNGLYTYLAANTVADPAGNSAIRYSKNEMVTAIRRDSSIGWFGIAIGHHEVGSIAFGFEPIVSYSYQLKRYKYNIDPCFYSSLAGSGCP